MPSFSNYFLLNWNNFCLFNVHHEVFKLKHLKDWRHQIFFLFYGAFRKMITNACQLWRKSVCSWSSPHSFFSATFYLAYVLINHPYVFSTFSLFLYPMFTELAMVHYLLLYSSTSIKVLQSWLEIFFFLNCIFRYNTRDQVWIGLIWWLPLVMIIIHWPLMHRNKSLGFSGGG